VDNTYTKESPVLPELVCLALAVYYEARSEPFPGQVAVAEVVLNRAKSARYPDDVCGVVTQGGTARHRCQFSYYCDGKPESPQHRHAWRRAVAIAKLTRNGVISAKVEDATHYHATYAEPYWRDHFDHIATIGRHLFYTTTSGSRRITTAAAEQSATDSLVASNL
jgi:spore germination cell wall hydrolase CwlJ-like protein